MTERDDWRNPLTGSALGPAQKFRIDGVVCERLSAGPYTYYRVEESCAVFAALGANGRSSEDRVWVVTMGSGPAAGDTVHFLPVGRARQFTSARLGCTSEPLLFGVVTRAELIENSHAKGS